MIILLIQAVPLQICRQTETCAEHICTDETIKATDNGREGSSKGRSAAKHVPDTDFLLLLYFNIQMHYCICSSSVVK